MKNNPLLSKEVNLKSISRGLKIGLPIAIIILVIGNHYTNLINNYLSDKYTKEKIVYVENKDVLGAQAEYQER